MCTSKPKQTTPAPTPAPETVDPQAVQAANRERRRVRTRYGQQSTILTNGIATPVTAQQKTLLGS